MTKKRPSFASLKRDLHLQNFLFRQASAVAAAAAATTSASASTPGSRPVSAASASRLADIASGVTATSGGTFSSIGLPNSAVAAPPPHSLHGRRESFLYRSSFDEHEIAPCHSLSCASSVNSSEPM
ncbi:unnamed protein product [Enterobius vermicularis]|uniref:Uncharacterized protein n=1 Tax=Enterobius vermicularis TaxID=51028 RepID=A0A0N4VPN6_ENTVE|nr:unnamed protein product [Enterobius vermicularis]